MNGFLTLWVLFGAFGLQLIFGGGMLKGRYKMPFDVFILVNFIGHCLITILALRILSDDLSAQGFRCGMPLAALFFGGMFGGALFLLTLLIQFILHHLRKKTT